MENIMRQQAGIRKIGKVWIKDNYDGEIVSYSSHFADETEFMCYCSNKIEGSTTKEIVKREFDNKVIA